jgi:hypothetical protein
MPHINKKKKKIQKNPKIILEESKKNISVKKIFQNT